MNWIKCSDREPDKTGEYLCRLNNDFVIQNYYISEFKRWQYGLINDTWRPPTVIAYWMPLPEPPKEEDEKAKAE